MTAKATMISFACSGCGRPFAVPASYAGRKATCKTCSAKVIVPGLSEAPASAPEPVMAGASANTNGKPHYATEESEPTVAQAPQRSEMAVSTADPATPHRRTSQIAVVSEAQSPPVAAALVSSGDTHVAVSLPAAELSPEYSDIAEIPNPAPAKIPVRIRRLMADAEQMAKAFSSGGPIRIKSAVGDPPELYQVEYHVKGLQKGWFGRPKKRATHVVEIQLTSEFPRVSPKCRMLTPVFHPNIDESTVCVTDHWTAGERLVDLVVRIGEMLAYQAYNIKSPLNGEAAMWADLNPKQLPVDTRNLHPGEIT